MTTLKLGVLAPLSEGPEEALRKVHALGLPTCQIGCRPPDLAIPDVGPRLIAAMKAHAVDVTTVWTNLPGREVWDFLHGPTTIGIVPKSSRAERIAALKRGADFARQVGVPSITTHAGFIPENPSDPEYTPVLEALRECVAYCQSQQLEFWFETGQETPITLLRVIEDLAASHLHNVGINLDPANLLMYGKANPVDALDVFGKYVRGVHAKDGEYPTNGRELGVEKPLGEGRVNFPALVPKLKSYGFTGALTIEREISGPKQIADIEHAISILTALA